MTHSVQQAVRERRSIKSFTETPVTRQTIQELLDLAILAPNHRMTHPFEFVVMGPETRRTYGRIKGDRRAGNIDDADVAEKVRQKTHSELEAVPAMVAFVQRLDEDPEIREEEYATIYMGVQSFLLAAVERGFGTHVKTGAIMEDPRTREALGLSEGERLVALVQLGEPAEVPAPRKRPSAAERTRWLE